MQFPGRRGTVLAKVLLMMVSLAAVTTPSSAEPGWQLRKDADGIRVYSRPLDGWTIHEIKGEVHLKAPLASILAVIDDVPRQSSLSEVVASSKVSRRDSKTRYQYYSVIEMPWPLKDRDIVSERQIKQDPVSLEVVVTDTAAPDALPLQKSLVRIMKSRQVWTMTPRADGVDVQMRVLSDPNGPIPASVVNAMSVGTPFRTLQNLRRLALQEPYKTAQPGFIATQR